MRVVIDNAALRKARSCKGAYTNREWDPALQALVFPDWDASVKELLSTPKGRARLEWYARHNLVPMTLDQFIAAKAALGVSDE
jgi:hypothetical protein